MKKSFTCQSQEEFKKIDKDILKISEGKSQVNFEIDTVEKPQLDS